VEDVAQDVLIPEMVWPLWPEAGLIMCQCIPFVSFVYPKTVRSRAQCLLPERTKEKAQDEINKTTHRYDVVRGAVHHLEQFEDEARRVVAPFTSLGRRGAGSGGGSLGGGAAAHGSYS